MSKLEELRGDLNNLDEEVAHKRERLAEQLNTLRENIIAGNDTTGDSLQDKLVVLYGADLLEHPEVEDKYKWLTESIKGNAGEPALVIRQWESLAPGCYGFGQKPRYEFLKSYELGVLSTEELVVDHRSSSCYLPTLGHSSWAYRRGEGPGIENETGGIPIKTTSRHLGGPPATREPAIELRTEVTPREAARDLIMHRTKPGLFVLIGKDQISEFIDASSTFIEPTLRRMAQSIGLQPIDSLATRRSKEAERASLLQRKAELEAQLNDKGAEVEAVQSQLEEIDRQADESGISLQ